MGIEQIQSAKTKALLPAFQFNWSQMESSSHVTIASFGGIMKKISPWGTTRRTYSTSRCPRCSKHFSSLWP